MANIDNILSKHSNNYRFHGVQAETLYRLINQSEDGSILLWGREHQYDIDEEEYGEYLQGAGYLSCTKIRDIEMSFNEFCGEGGIVLVLEKQVEEPFDFQRKFDRREHIIRVEEWSVVGGLRPILDEDGDVVDQEAFDLDEIFAEF